MSLQDRWNMTCADVADICTAAHRNPDEVKIIAVSKTVDVATVGEAITCGMADFGENRTASLEEKYATYPNANWHFIGQLQSKKAKDVVGKAALIHSLDRVSLLNAIQAAAQKMDVIQDVLIEVSISGEESKAGMAPAEVPALLDLIAEADNVRCKGLMTMAPRGDEDVARRTFAGLRELASDVVARYGISDSICFDDLSMGMSEDYRVAIEEGATLVRIGRKIFSEDFGS